MTVPGGCRSQGCHSYHLRSLPAPFRFFRHLFPHPSIVDWFKVVLTDFPELVHVKSLKKKRKKVFHLFVVTEGNSEALCKNFNY